MKITAIEPIRIGSWLLVRVRTDEGITGLGQSGAWAFLDASAAALARMESYLIGADPFRIEFHQQYIYRAHHFRGAAISGALSAVDIALWDIKGKKLGVPVYELLGGRSRDKIRVYKGCKGETEQALIDNITQAKAEGFTAVGHLEPFPTPDRSETYFKTHAQKIEDAIDLTRRYREAVGPEVDLCIEIHRRLTPNEAVVLARGIEPYHPMFYEDPTWPDNIDQMKWIADRIHIPIATGERYHTVFEFDMLLKKGAASFVRPDVCLCGGITGLKKIAALAEGCQVGVIPHNPLGPVCGAASLQVSAVIPNFAIQESGVDASEPPLNEVFRSAWRCERGYLNIPDTPGIGIELIEGAEDRIPRMGEGATDGRPLVTRLQSDGSIMDQ